MHASLCFNCLIDQACDVTQLQSKIPLFFTQRATIVLPQQLCKHWPILFKILLNLLTLVLSCILILYLETLILFRKIKYQWRPFQLKLNLLLKQSVLTGPTPETSTRFTSLNSQEIDDIVSEGDSKRTKATKPAARILHIKFDQACDVISMVSK